MPPAQKFVVDEAKIRKAIVSGFPLTLTTFTLPREMEAYIESIIVAFLKHAGQEKLRDYIVYCVQELAVNAKKANTKRVYFIEQGLNLSDPGDYQKGMENFKDTTLGNIAHYLELQEKQGLYIRLILQIQENTINIEIRNNVVVTRAELIRIHDRLARSRQFSTMEDALSQVLDDSEGAGLGLVILVLMLKKMGLDEDCFNLHSSSKETIARITVPLDKLQVENVSVLSGAIANSVSSLPQFPENILAVQRLIAGSNADMGAIARQLSMDPALTADLLRIVNSAQYMLVRRVDSIFDAVKMVGIQGIRNLLYSYGTQQILGSDTQEKKQLWEHCYKTAYYAYSLAAHSRRDRTLLDDVYVSGILHDMGKIIFSNVHPELLDKIKNFCAERNIPTSTIEDLSAGMNHAEIGALIAEKWNFPDTLVNTIRYHHNPAAADENCRDLVECVYLANMLCEYEDGNATFDQIEAEPLARFGISDQNHLDSLLNRFSQGFKKENEH
ncbi:MAG: HDOD domain-containing protein [Treponema sp.]|nr:HDOD domain-containing protein [Treponema sp.]